MPGFTSSVFCITSAILCSSGLPTVQGFGFRPISQSKFRTSRHPSDLKYRSHPDALSVEQHEHAQRMQASASIAEKVQQDSKPAEHHVSNIFHTWWTASKTRRAQLAVDTQADTQEKDQIILDNYLESIDRRYRRMHSHDKKSKKNDPDTVSNVAWNFLTQIENSAVEEQRKQEDAIYVLGLAELASNKLLQKHHLPIPTSKQQYQYGSTVIDVQDNTVIENTNSKVRSKPVSFEPKVRAVTLVTTAVFCIEFVKNMQKAYMNRLSLISNKAKDAMQFGGKAISATLASAANLITANGGGVSKYAIHFVSIFALAVASKNTTLSALRTLTKA